MRLTRMPTDANGYENGHVSNKGEAWAALREPIKIWLWPYFFWIHVIIEVESTHEIHEIQKSPKKHSSKSWDKTSKLARNVREAHWSHSLRPAIRTSRNRVLHKRRLEYKERLDQNFKYQTSWFMSLQYLIMPAAWWSPLQCQTLPTRQKHLKQL